MHACMHITAHTRRCAYTCMHTSAHTRAHVQCSICMHMHQCAYTHSIYMCMHVHVNTYRAHQWACTRGHTRLCTQCSYTSMHKHAHTSACVCGHACTHTCAYMYVAHVHMCVHECMHIYISMHAQICMYTHLHTHIFVLYIKDPGSLSRLLKKLVLWGPEASWKDPMWLSAPLSPLWVMALGLRGPTRQWARRGCRSPDVV